MFIKPDSPFYKNPALWLVVGLPLAAVIVGTLFIIYSIKYDDGDVIDDYYKKGKQINITIERDERAAQNQLSASMAFDKTKKLLNLTLDAKQGFVYPQALSFKFIHRTLSARDIELKLVKQQDGQYFAVLSDLPASHWHLELGTEQWRLKGQIEYPQNANALLDVSSTVQQSQH